MERAQSARRFSRLFQLTALLLVVVAAVQLAWWLIDLRAWMGETAQHVQALHAQQHAAAQALREAGVPEQRIAGLLPGADPAAGAAAAGPLEALAAEHRRRWNQYAWEGAFFLLALCAGIVVIWRALRAETRILREQDSFLALVSHQFKTPLASLQLSLETMALRELPPEHAQRLIARMLDDVARMETMVSHILDSARLERGRVELRREPVELAGAVARVIAQLEERARRERIAIRNEVPRGVQVLADPLSVDVVVRNLLENALAAVAPVGGGTVTLASRAANGEVELIVRDSGVGFRPADRLRLFEKFSRLHPGGGSSYGGTGLGLYIVHRLMELTGGRVSARSGGLGQGAEFVLAWPAAPVEPA